jgi:putative SOS response-associated peptidase YedK
MSRWQEQTTCLLITTTPNEVVRPVHDRMPVMLHHKDYGKWLDPDATPDDLLAILRPFPDDELVRQEVSTRVNKSTNQGAQLIEPVEAADDDRGLF